MIIIPTLIKTKEKLNNCFSPIKYVKNIIVVSAKNNDIFVLFKKEFFINK